MSKNPDGTSLPPQNVQDHLSWRFAAIVTFAAAIGELMTHLLVQHLMDGWCMPFRSVR